MNTSSVEIHKSQAGYIIVAVVWILAALAALASIYSAYVVNSAPGFGARAEAVQGEAFVFAALNLATYQLTAQQTKRPSQGRFTFYVDKVRVNTEFRSEASRIDLNYAPKEMLLGLFLVVGSSRPDAESYAERIIQWRAGSSESIDSEAVRYRRAGLGYLPRGDRFPHVGELGLVIGLPTGLLGRIEPFVTVYSGRPQINIVSAAPDVLKALPGTNWENVNAVLREREQLRDDGRSLLQLLGPAASYGTVEPGRTLRVFARIDMSNGRHLSAEAVILISEEGPHPFEILTWIDRGGGDN